MDSALESCALCELRDLCFYYWRRFVFIRGLARLYFLPYNWVAFRA